MAPTYFRREPGIDAPTAIAAPHYWHPMQPSTSAPAARIADAKAAIRRDAQAKRDVLPADLRAQFLKHAALRRVGKREEIANLVTWLALENTYVTGQALVADGGL